METELNKTALRKMFDNMSDSDLTEIEDHYLRLVEGLYVKSVNLSHGKNFGWVLRVIEGMDFADKHNCLASVFHVGEQSITMIVKYVNTEEELKCLQI